jgi:hypothetical protein
MGEGRDAGKLVRFPAPRAVVKFGFAGHRLRSIDVTVHGVPPRAA